MWRGRAGSILKRDLLWKDFSLEQMFTVADRPLTSVSIRHFMNSHFEHARE